ncbi:hypothetical protein Tco_1150828, partial [Tanacetum coccineum]
MEGSSEEEALFRSYPYAALYFVQSPTASVSFHSPAATQRRFMTLSHYSSSRGSTNNSFLHDKTIPENDDAMVLKIDENNVHGVGDEVESEDEEEEHKSFGKKMRDLVSFSESDSCVWMWFQISLRVMVSFGVALLFFYLITKPPPPVISLK